MANIKKTHRFEAADNSKVNHSPSLDDPGVRTAVNADDASGDNVGAVQVSVVNKSVESNARTDRVNVDAASVNGSGYSVQASEVEDKDSGIPSIVYRANVDDASDVNGAVAQVSVVNKSGESNAVIPNSVGVNVGVACAHGSGVPTDAFAIDVEEPGPPRSIASVDTKQVSDGSTFYANPESDVEGVDIYLNEDVNLVEINSIECRTSITPFLLLHHNIGCKHGDYNPFMNMDVNIRSTVIPAKLSGSNPRDNLLLAVMNGTAIETLPGRNPLVESGTFEGVLSSFSPTIDDKWIIKPTSEPVDEGAGTALYATPATPKILKKAIKWLTLPETSSTKTASSCESVQELFANFMAFLTAANIHGKKLADLIDFIKSRKWEGDLWCGPSDAFISDLAKFECTEQRRLCVRYIVFNMSHQTRIAIFPVDSLHRIAAIDMLVNGIAPNYIVGETAEIFKTFVDSIQTVIVDEHHLLYSLKFDMMLKMNLYRPEKLYQQFGLYMLTKSAESQMFHDKSTPHTVMNLLDICMRRVLTPIYESAKTPWPLYINKDFKHGLRRLCDHAHEFNQDISEGLQDFYTILKTDNLLHGDINGKETYPEIEKLFRSDKPQGKPDTDFHYKLHICFDVYIHLWIFEFTKSLHESITALYEGFVCLNDLVPDILIRQISEMNVADFQKFWPKKTINQHHIFSLAFMKDGLDRMLPGKQDPFRNRTVGCLNTSTIDFLFTLTLASLSPDCYSCINIFAATKHAPTVRQIAAGTPEQASRMIRICLLLVRTISDTSYDYWHQTYFSRSIVPTTIWCNKMQKSGVMVMLLMSAVKHTYEFAIYIGVNPSENTFIFTEQQLESMWKIGESSKWHIVRRVLADPVLLFAIDFYQSIIRGEKMIEKVKNEEANLVNYRLTVAQFLDASINADLSTTDVTVLKPKKEEKNNKDAKIWLGDISYGERDTLAMEALDPNLSLVEVLGHGDGGNVVDAIVLPSYNTGVHINNGDANGVLPLIIGTTTTLDTTPVATAGEDGAPSATDTTDVAAGAVSATPPPATVPAATSLTHRPLEHYKMVPNIERFLKTLRAHANFEKFGHPIEVQYGQRKSPHNSNDNDTGNMNGGLSNNVAREVAAIGLELGDGRGGVVGNKNTEQAVVDGGVSQGSAAKTHNDNERGRAITSGKRSIVVQENTVKRSETNNKKVSKPPSRGFQFTLADYFKRSIVTIGDNIVSSRQIEGLVYPQEFGELTPDEKVNFARAAFTLYNAHIEHGMTPAITKGKRKREGHGKKFIDDEAKSNCHDDTEDDETLPRNGNEYIFESCDDDSEQPYDANYRSAFGKAVF